MSTSTHRKPHPQRISAGLAGFLVLAGIVTGGEWSDRRGMLPRLHQVGRLRVWYALSGPEALPRERHSDADDDGTPDYVQDVATQLVAAERIFVDVLGFRHPLDSPRYSRAEFVDVHLLAPPFGSKRGVAYDGIQRIRRPDGSRPRTLAIDLSVNNETTNSSPAHEFFHLIQNGYSMFKNRWFTEGTARWAESIVEAGGGRPGELPESEAEWKALGAQTYSASGAWIRMAHEADAAGRFAVPPDLAAARYRTADAPVVPDDRLHGAAFMVRLLEELEVESGLEAKAHGLDRYGWKEARQKSPVNDPAIRRAIARARAD